MIPLYTVIYCLKSKQFIKLSTTKQEVKAVVFQLNLNIYME